jgi:Carboxypeptidase regulatory-like domain
MRERMAKLAACAVLMIFSLATPALRAQEAAATLSGRVADSSGAAVPNAKVSIRNLKTGQAADIQTDRTGTFNLPKLVPGDYEVTVSVQGFAVKADKVTLTAGATLTYNATLTALPRATTAISREFRSQRLSRQRSIASGLGVFTRRNQRKSQGTGAAGKTDTHAENPPTVGPDHNAPDDRVGGHVHQCGRQGHEQYGPNGAHDFGFRYGGLVLYNRILCDPRAARAGNKIPRADSLS